MSDKRTLKVRTGMWVKVRGAILGQETFEDVYQFVPIDEVDITQNKISMDSPLGQALAGAKVGETAKVETGGGVLDLVVLDLGHG